MGLKGFYGEKINHNNIGFLGNNSFTRSFLIVDLIRACC